MTSRPWPKICPYCGRTYLARNRNHNRGCGSPECERKRLADVDPDRPCTRDGCGELLARSARSNAEYHSPACQMQAQRQRAAGDRPVRTRTALSPKEVSAAQRRRAVERKRRTRENGGVAPTARHGAGTYTNWGCRCEVCCEAHRAIMQEEYEARRVARESDG